jgi:hypothetical protein
MVGRCLACSVPRDQFCPSDLDQGEEAEPTLVPSPFLSERSLLVAKILTILKISVI